jgi:CDP-4-dehydro-6-deoxyglucose reductase, E3
MAFQVTLQPSGNRFECADNQEILKAGLAAGFLLPFSCRSGMCRSCRGTVLQGQVNFGAAHEKYLSEADRGKGLALLCCALPCSDLVIELDEVDPDRGSRPKRMPARVLSLDRPITSVSILTLGLPANEPMLFQAGQFLDILLADGKRRSYSIANAPKAEGVRQLELHLRHLPGGAFTDHVFGAMKVREMVHIEMPLGQFYLREDSARPLVLVATGTGFAPVKSMVLRLLERNSQRPVRLYWGGRSVADLYQHELASQWAREHPHISFIPVLSRPDSTAPWPARSGHVQQAVLSDLPDLSGHDVYACGSAAMVADAEKDFVQLGGLPPAQFFADAFLSERDRASLPTLERV